MRSVFRSKSWKNGFWCNRKNVVDKQGGSHYNILRIENAFCGSAGIGRQARLRCVCQPTWEFKSPLPHHVVADFESFATAFSFSKKRRLSFSPSLLLSKSNPLRWASILIQRRGGAARSNRNTMSRTSNRSRRRFLFQRNAAFVHGQGRRFFDEIFRLRRMNCALRTKGDSPARHTCSFCNSGSSFAHFSSAVSGFFSFYGGLFCRFSLTRVFFHIILKVRFRTLR